jgi:DNA-binding MarR family transcriptional regulator
MADLKHLNESADEIPLGCDASGTAAPEKTLTQRTRRERGGPGEKSPNTPLDISRYNKYCWHMKRSSHAKHDPLPIIEARVYFRLMRAADALSRGAEILLKSHGLSGTQYNVLRILRDGGENGLACREIGCRLISRDPDITRLLDRMESRGWIARARETEDRRVVKTRVTAEGLRLLAELDMPVDELHRRQFCHLPASQLRRLSNLLGRACKQEEVEGEEEYLPD